MRSKRNRRQAFACAVETLERREVLSTVTITPGRFVSSPGAGRGLVAVAVLGGSDFDAERVAPSSVTVSIDGADPVRSARPPRIADVNGDGVPDLVVFVRRNALKGQSGAASVDVTGATKDALGDIVDFGSGTLTLARRGRVGRASGRDGQGVQGRVVINPVMTPIAPPSEIALPDATPASGPLSPALIRHAYGFDQLSLDGTGQTIAIIDAYDNPTIVSDLSTFDAQFGLPAPPSFTKAIPQGLPAYDSLWASEIALDVEWAHAIAPGAKILLVEAKSSSNNDLLSAVDYAYKQGVSQITMSWGGYESILATNYDSHFKHPGVTFLASSGDNGAQVQYPASSPYVTGVGGTSLQVDTSGNRLGESAWGGSGGGTSTVESSPSFQAGFAPRTGRGVADVAYNADPGSGYSVYVGGGWYQYGGTSAGAPQWAGLMALVNQGRVAAHKKPIGSGLTFGTNTALYALAGSGRYTNANGDFYDITAGSNGYSATVGYDVPTGLGAPVANKLVADLIKQA